jgi:hypothetical protein
MDSESVLNGQCLQEDWGVRKTGEVRCEMK